MMPLDAAKAPWLRARLKRIRPIRALGNWVRVQQTLRALRGSQDYQLSRRSGVYRLTYDNRLGYQPAWPDASFVFDYDQWAWVVEVAGQRVLTEGCPLWQLIMELRGYLLVYQPGPGDVVLDVGASTGFISAVLARMVGDAGHLVCIEPNPADAQALRDALALNKLNNCSVVEAALAGQDGTATLALAGGASHLAAPTPNGQGQVRVPTIRLPTLLSKVPPDRTANIRLIKLDIEGAEVEVLDDLLAFLQSNRQVVIAIAAYHPYQGGATHTWIEQRCRPLPFVMAKTIFPIHRTTMLVHAANAAACQRLASLPASDKRNG